MERVLEESNDFLWLRDSILLCCQYLCNSHKVLKQLLAEARSHGLVLCICKRIFLILCKKDRTMKVKC